MSGKNFSALGLSPGVFSDSTQYGAGKHWYDANQVRWLGEVLVPVGGWRSIKTVSRTNQLIESETFNLPAWVKTNCTITPNATNSPILTLTADKLIPANGVIGSMAQNYSYVAGTTYTFSIYIKAAELLTYTLLIPGTLFSNGIAPSFSYNLLTGVATRLTGIDALTDTEVSDNGWWRCSVTFTPQNSVITGVQVRSEVNGNAANGVYIWGAQQNKGLIPNDYIITVATAVIAGLNPLRDLFSWRDQLKNPWLAAGAADKLYSLSVNAGNTFTLYDITPSSLAWVPGAGVGYGRGAWGSGPYGIDDSGSAGTIDASALWSMDNFGKDLIAVHSQDGRLFKWDPLTPSTIATLVTQAPIDNTLCIMSNEEFCFVLGGKNNPRRVKWASQRSLTDWTATEINSAGGFDLQSNGTIVSVTRVPEGILVVTTSDVHVIQYVGPPNYYGRRRISNEGSIIGKNCLVSIPGGAIWMGHSDFWIYLGGTVNKLPCSVHTYCFYNSELTQPQSVFLGINEFAAEVWAFFPPISGAASDNYAAMNYAKLNYWTKGNMNRTAWHNPTWQVGPIAALDQVIYEQEFGWTADGVSRNGLIFAETGGLEIGEGDDVMRVDRVYQDAGNQQNSTFVINDPLAFTASFKLKQAPNAPERTYGPINLGDVRGYTTVRFRARQIVMRITQAKDEPWTLGALRLRLKPGGKR